MTLGEAAYAFYLIATRAAREEKNLSHEADEHLIRLRWSIARRHRSTVADLEEDVVDRQKPHVVPDVLLKRIDCPIRRKSLNPYELLGVDVSSSEDVKHAAKGLRVPQHLLTAHVTNDRLSPPHAEEKQVQDVWPRMQEQAHLLLAPNLWRDLRIRKVFFWRHIMPPTWNQVEFQHGSLQEGWLMLAKNIDFVNHLLY